jgi:hypothetical protein
MSLILQVFKRGQLWRLNGRSLLGVQNFAPCYCGENNCGPGCYFLDGVGMARFFFFAAVISGRRASTEMPRVPPENPSMYAALIPITSAWELNTGPPLPPWAVGAS